MVTAYENKINNNDETTLKLPIIIRKSNIETNNMKIDDKANEVIEMDCEKCSTVTLDDDQNDNSIGVLIIDEGVPDAEDKMDWFNLLPQLMIVA